MSRTVADRGPAAPFPIPGVATVIPNIGLTVTDVRGPMKVSATVDIDHGGLGTGVTTVQIVKNGAVLNNTAQSVRVIGPDRVGVSLMTVDTAPAVGDVYAVDIIDTVVDVLNVVPLNGAVLVCEAVPNDGAYVTNVGAATP